MFHFRCVGFVGDSPEWRKISWMVKTSVIKRANCVCPRIWPHNEIDMSQFNWKFNSFVAKTSIVAVKRVVSRGMGNFEGSNEPVGTRSGLVHYWYG